jgi:membrane protein
VSAAGPSPGAASYRARRGLQRLGRAVRRHASLSARAAWVALRRLGLSDDLTFASSIAYYALLSIFPLLLLLFSLLGRLTGDPADQAALVDLLLRYFPRRVEFITTQLNEVQGAGIGLSLAGTVVLCWTAMGVFRAISSAVNHAWHVERRRSFLRHQASAFLMLLTAGGLLLAALVLASVTEMMATSWFGQLLTDVPGLMPAVDLALRYPATLLLIVVAGLILYFVPNTDVHVGDVWVGAVLTGVLWRGALDGFSWYLGLGVVSIRGSVAAIVVFLLWVYVSAVILIYGVEFSAAYARLRRD